MAGTRENNTMKLFRDTPPIIKFLVVNMDAVVLSSWARGQKPNLKMNRNPPTYGNLKLKAKSYIHVRCKYGENRNV
jgi:hypothetical protein